ncbi:uncharacterized protein N7459_005870 [Penicillium hispanicum]|uniref:uncharacterized protein n=1 Tax=Penicillium hispanicum TaxID=1080232 RepID=UPI00253FB007|nr:uncharacterized protein N7459_005870 [Penicillium hispanicum]KAJ5579885.1 hypothetical protein N7459_005870 [Penicillium hispanicum]
MKRAVSLENRDRDTSSEPVPLSSLKTAVSPPRRRRKINQKEASNPEPSSAAAPPPTGYELSAIESGKIEVTDHLGIISKKLDQYSRPIASQLSPRLPIDAYTNLYRRNKHPEGRHFVIHQHDHPLAGPHYDLRLQFSETSSVSWSVMYGMPGDPNSKRLNRNATETRVHCLWNHLIETASSQTGSLIIWDTGEYEILPYHAQSLPETDDSQSKSPSSEPEEELVSDSAKLREAFRNRKIRLRLHGTRLPSDYTVILRMDKGSNFARPIHRGPKRRRKGRQSARTATPAPSTSGSELEVSLPTESQPSEANEASGNPESGPEQGNHSDDDIDFQIRRDNAYPGSSNTIGSIHQRRWFLSLDRENSGFEPKSEFDKNSNSTKKMWVRKLRDTQNPQGFEPFYVRGPDIERSVVTGRLGRDVLDDEGVEDFLPRKGWQPVLH